MSNHNTSILSCVYRSSQHYSNIRSLNFYCYITLNKSITFAHSIANSWFTEHYNFIFYSIYRTGTSPFGIKEQNWNVVSEYISNLTCMLGNNERHMFVPRGRKREVNEVKKFEDWHVPMQVRRRRRETVKLIRNY